MQIGVGERHTQRSASGQGRAMCKHTKHVPPNTIANELAHTSCRLRAPNRREARAPTCRKSTPPDPPRHWLLLRGCEPNPGRTGRGFKCCKLPRPTILLAIEDEVVDWYTIQTKQLDSVHRAVGLANASTAHPTKPIHVPVHEVCKDVHDRLALFTRV